VTTRRGRVAWVRTALALTAALALAGTGCTTTGNDAARSIPSVEHVACPPEVSVVTVLALTCGYVTVPEDRSQPGGAKVRLFVFQIDPDGPTTGAPVIFLGGEIGSSFDYGNVAAVATLLPGHELIAIELRGTGHSEPNLSCPEVDALAGRARAETITEPQMRQAFVDAAASCRARIASRGIDLAAFDVSEMAADVLDVVGAMHLSEWEMLSKGSTSRVVFEAMRADPPGLRGVVLYNPEFPDTDPFVQAFESTRASLARLAEACRADRVCGSHFPDVERDTRAAIQRLQAHPLVVRDGGAPVLMDGAALLRNLRALLSSVPANPETVGRLPATIAAIARGSDRVHLLTRLAGLDDSPQTYCSGYLPECSTAQTLNQGAYYSVLCRDEVPFSHVAAMSELARGDAAWVADYIHSPYLDVCDAWDVPPADASVTEPIISDVPVYIYSGAFSPFVMPAEVQRGIDEGLSRVALGVAPVNSSDLGLVDVTGADCADLRLGFIDDPLAPVDFGCLADGYLQFFVSPI
jgi:pimeloyl-ACP methyl ester carboxylesterase